MALIGVIGSGAVGAVLASAAVRAGHEVVVCARTPVAGLVVEDGGRVEELPAPVVTDPARVRAVDWILLTTKAHDTASAAGWLPALRGPDTVLVVVRNGVEHLDATAPIAAGLTTLPALIYVGAERIANGRVRVHGGLRRLVVPDNPTGRALAAQLTDTALATEPSTELSTEPSKAPNAGQTGPSGGSGLDVMLEPDFTTAAWRKLLSNVAANPITALTLRRTEVLREPAVRELVEALLTEAVAVGRASGARLTDADVAATLDFYRAFPDGTGTSMLYDRLAGRRTEHDLINGVVVRLGREHGVPTPANQAVHALLDAAATLPAEEAVSL